MRKRIICWTLLLALFLSISSSAMAVATRSASGRSSLSNSGKKITYSGYSTSSRIEDTITVTIKLMELRNGTWYEVDRTSKSDTNSDYVSASDNYTVVGGYYYKVIGIHYSKTGTQITNTQSESSTIWIGA